MDSISRISFNGRFMGSTPRSSFVKNFIIHSLLNKAAKNFDADTDLILLGQNNLVPVKISREGVLGAGIAGPSIDFKSSVAIIKSQINKFLEVNKKQKI